ncbi:MAG TPA: copper oxidase [Thermoanaerobaculia bacterium]|nr:copper oxidase [Thermoanaerobaculia bacterium]
MKGRGLAAGLLAASLAALGAAHEASAQRQPPIPAGCNAVTYADVVALDQPFSWNRFGAIEPQGMMYALRRDVVPTSDPDGLPDPGIVYTLTAGQVTLRRDKRPRPLVLRVNAGDCLHVTFTNLLSPTVASGKDEQPATRNASMHFVGMEAVQGISDMGANVGNNPASGNGVVAPNGSIDYWLYGVKEGTYTFYSTGAMTGGEGDSGSISSGLFGAVNVEPAGSVWYRSQVTRDDLDLARTDVHNSAVDSFPTINYAAVYPAGHRYAGKPILLMKSGNEIVHSDLTAIIAGPAPTYLLSGMTSTKTYPNRDQPFREFTIIFHDEIGAVQAFPQFETDQLHFTLHSVRDAFAINYGTGGAGAEVLANRVGVGPARDCPECKYEEFFLSSWALGDPAMVVNRPANAPCTAAQIQAGNTACYSTGSKATIAYYPDDPSNVYHSYISDHVKFRNDHAGSDDHHIFHLHAHQWLHSPLSDGSSYKDSQSIGQGAGYTYEIAYGGSGNRNKTVGDSIFHCHFYPHFAQGMWSLWRSHDVLELGTRIDASGKPVAGARALPDNEIVTGTPIPAIVPIPVLAMAPLPGPVSIVAGQVSLPATITQNPGYPFFIPGLAGRRAPHPPLDFALNAGVPIDGGLPRHVVINGTAASTQTRFDFEKTILTANVKWLGEAGEPVEQVAMNFHHTPGGFATVTPLGAPGTFKVNGHPGQHGAPYADPCFDDAGNAITDVRYYKAADMQLDVKYNKAGWHYPQARMLALWGDVSALLAGTKAPEPFFFRANSGQCIEFWHTNLVPNKYVVDDFQVTTPTDVLGQHIHLVKFDVTSSDGSGNGWNYEDGSFGGEEVQERICAIRQAQPGRCGEPVGGCKFAGTATTNCPLPKVHPFFTQTRDADCNGVNDFLGAQTTVQRWWADPITNQDGTKRTLRTIFTHDHFGPSTHQQTGLYAGLVIEPAGSLWFHNETGTQLGTNSGPGLTQDGGPTTWQAVIEGSAVKDNYREFMIEFADFQPMYTPGGPLCPNPSLSVGWTDLTRAVNPPGRAEDGLPFLYAKPVQCPVPDGSGTFLAPPCPEAVSADDIGLMTVNYRDEPVGLRVRNPTTNLQANGKKGDLSFAYQSRTDRADAAFNVQPAFYPPLTGDLTPGDPYTPLLRSFEGDQVKIRTLVGAHEEPHNFSVHGVKWLFEPDDADSGYRNSQMAGISEWFDFEIPRIPSLVSGTSADILYTPSSATESQWTGAWGLIRVYRNDTTASPSTAKFSLKPLASYNPTARSATPDEVFDTIPASQAQTEGVPGADVSPGTATPQSEGGSGGTVTAAQPGSSIRIACPVGAPRRTYNVVAVSAAEVLKADPIGLAGLVYNPRAATVTGPNGSFSGPLFDPTAIMFVFASDLTYVGSPARPRLNQNVRREPLILRANAGECIKVSLYNDISSKYSDAPGYTGVNMIVPDFNQNQVAPSMEVSLHPQLVYYDVQRSDGSNVGLNPSNFGRQSAAIGETRTYYWYAGDVKGSTTVAIEFGATGLTSSDPIKHSNKGAMGALLIEPATSTWALDTDSNLKTTRAAATVSSSTGAFKPFKEFAFVIQDDVNLQFAGGTPVPNLDVDDDPENSGQKAINYRAEPLWYRGGWGPETPITGNGPGFTTRQFTQFDLLLHNSWVGGDPETPVFQASAGQPLRFRVVHPSGHTQAHVFEAQGHPWPERPYVLGTNSTQIGNNSISELFGTRGGVGPTDHFDALIPDGAGGKFKITGDYLWRDYPGPRLDAGIWGILRVVP